MLTSRFRVFSAFFLLLALSSMVAFQPPVVTSSRLADPFSTGWMLSDTNGDGVVDFVAGKVVVPASPSAAENAAASLRVVPSEMSG